MNTPYLTTIKPLEKNRYFNLFIFTIVQFSVGISYIWSVFQPFVMSEFNWDATTASLTNTIAILAFVFGSLISGKVQEKFIAAKVVILSGIIMSLGCFLAAFTPMSSPLFLYITFGLITGTGFGIVYNLAVTLSQKWFYDKRGMASGVVVSSLGFAGLLFTPVINFTLSRYGLKVTFFLLGIFFLLINFIASFWVKEPQKDYIKSGKNAVVASARQYTPIEIIKTRSYYMLLISLTCASIAYILITPLLIVLGTQRGIGMSLLLTGVMLSSLSNAVGRLFFASLSDKIGRKPTLIILYVITLLSCFGLFFAGGNMFITLFATLCFAYGGFLAIFPVLTSGLFGIEHSATNYGLVLLGLGLGCLISIVIALAIQALGLDITYRFIVSLVLSAVGIIFAALIKRPTQV